MLAEAPMKIDMEGSNEAQRQDWRFRAKAQASNCAAGINGGGGGGLTRGSSCDRPWE